MAQDGLLGQQGKHLARQEGLKADHFARADKRPFGMGAGQADHTIKAGMQCQSPRDLGFLAAHHIGGRGLRQAGRDVDSDARIGGRHAGQGGGINGRAALRRSLVLTAFIGVPVAAAVGVVGPTAIRVLFGPSFAVEPVVLWLLLPGTLVFGVSFMMLDQLATVVPRWKLTVTCGLGLVGNILLDLFAIPRFGIAGAAASSSISYVVPFVILLAIARSALPRTNEQDLP